jgi:hypothetical protein
MFLHYLCQRVYLRLYLCVNLASTYGRIGVDPAVDLRRPALTCVDLRVDLSVDATICGGVDRRRRWVDAASTQRRLASAQRRRPGVD